MYFKVISTVQRHSFSHTHSSSHLHFLPFPFLSFLPLFLSSLLFFLPLTSLSFTSLSPLPYPSLPPSHPSLFTAPSFLSSSLSGAIFFSLSLFPFFCFLFFLRSFISSSPALSLCLLFYFFCNYIKLMLTFERYEFHIRNRLQKIMAVKF